MDPTIRRILVLGSGSAGLLAAISLKRKIPELDVRVVRSPDIGVIGVGEGTTPGFPSHLFDYLGINRKRFYALAEPVWKLGIRFLWGPRPHFDYTFGNQLDAQWSGLPLPNGYYCEKDFSRCDLPAALMEQGKAFARLPDGGPDIQGWHGFHIENRKLVDALEEIAVALGIAFIDGRVTGAERGGEGIGAVYLEDGRRLPADFFIDASGFRAELIGRALEEPFVDFGRSLFCDRAVVGGWERGGEPILPYTTAETMDAGWAWQIEHEHHVNRGYVFCSAEISDDQAVAEFLRKNPKAGPEPRVVKFTSGRRQRLWVDNVVAVGNAAGFVEPLEATALMVVCAECRMLVDLLRQSACRPTPTLRRLFNEVMAEKWDEIRDFLALHYRANTRLDTPFWRRCRAETDLSTLDEFLAFYRENGPSGYARQYLPAVDTDFGMSGYLVMLVGNLVPYDVKRRPTPEEAAVWRQVQAGFAARAADGLDVAEALAFVRHPDWAWAGDPTP